MRRERPPAEWDDDMQLDNVFEIDEHIEDVKIDESELNYLFMPREEGEGFYEHMERTMAGIEDLDVEHAVDRIEEELGPDDDYYDDEDYYDDGEYPDEDDR